MIWQWVVVLGSIQVAWVVLFDRLFGSEEMAETTAEWMEKGVAPKLLLLWVSFFFGNFLILLPAKNVEYFNWMSGLYYVQVLTIFVMGLAFYWVFWVPSVILTPIATLFSLLVWNFFLSLPASYRSAVYLRVIPPVQIFLIGRSGGNYFQLLNFLILGFLGIFLILLTLYLHRKRLPTLLYTEQKTS